MENAKNKNENWITMLGKMVHNDIFFSIAICVLFAAIIFEWGFSFVGGRQSFVYLFDILFAIVWLLIFRKLFKNKNDFKNERTLILFIVGFGAYFIFFLVNNIVKGISINDSTILLRPLLWGTAGYLILSLNKNMIKPTIKALMVLTTLLSISLIIYLFIYDDGIRKIKMLGNIIPCMILEVFGALFWYLIIRYKKYEKKKHRILIKCCGYFNIFIALFISIGSGTRTFLPLCFGVLLVLLCSNEIKFRSILKKAAILVLTIIIISLSMLNFNLFNSAENIYRTYSIFDKEFISSLDVIDFKITNNTDSEGVLDKDELVAEENIQLSNGMRDVLWDASLEMIGGNLLMGQGEITVLTKMENESTAEGYSVVKQAPHNFVLEVLLSLGVIGLIIYMFIVLTPFVQIASSNVRVRTKISIILVFIIIFLPSLTQPLITTKLILSLPFWILLAVVPYLSEENKTQKT